MRNKEHINSREDNSIHLMKLLLNIKVSNLMCNPNEELVTYQLPVLP